MTVLDDRPEQFSWATTPPNFLGPWAHAAHASATVVTRFDYGGVCTWMHVSVGEMLLFVATHMSGKKGAGETIKAGLTKVGVIDEDKLAWSFMRVRAGDDM